MNDRIEKIGNIDAERVVIQGLLEDWNRVNEFELTVKDFTDDLYIGIFKLLVKHNGSEVLVGGEIKKAGGLLLEEWMGIISYTHSYITKNLEDCVLEVKKYTKRREQLAITDAIHDAIRNGASEDKVMQMANKLYETESIKQQSRDEVKQEIIDDIFGDKDVKRFLTNYTRLDLITGGFYPNQLITIAARPGVGKTMIALNFISNQLQVGHKVAFFSLEMSTKELYQRLYSRYGELEVNKIKGSKPMAKGDEAKLEKAIETVSKFETNLTLYDDKHGLGEIVNQIRLLHSKGMVDIVYIDYVQLIEVKAENRNLEISKITRTLKMLAMQLKIPIVILAQLSRAVEKRYGGDEPILSDLRDSGSIEQDSDVVLMLHRLDNQYLKILVRKNRNGPLGPVYQFINSMYMQIGEIDDKTYKTLDIN